MRRHRHAAGPARARRPPARTARARACAPVRPAGSRSRRRPAGQGRTVVVDCAVYVDGRRQAPVDARRTRCGWPPSSGGFVWLGLYEPTEDELDAHRRRGTACTRWPSRTPSTPTSGPSSSTTTTRCSWCSRRRPTWSTRS